ncbi:hypothetical protein [Serratia rubidaea]|uniref:hypothetical protein n=1 Tax=Serratia rubidaea TaxID=61652 RepID=UPI000774B36D|nr:hypothetical protein [Serratia rubidaea]AML55921.1 hypothetical protein AXX16_0161 [Serratia rubidaea]WBF45142.1 hypothetical protein OLD77_21385 [Serratia rubidaea]
MRELSTSEQQEVSGGLFGLITAPIGGILGAAIGSIVDAGNRVAGRNSNFTGSGALLGAGIGAAVGLSPITAILGIGAGVVSIVRNGLGLKGQKTLF